ncbi:rRNA maturation RNase YbeY [Flavobacteriaceae bacterium M23B6Z8]
MNTLENKISFQYQVEFFLDSEEVYRIWIDKIIQSQDKVLGQLTFVFCSDESLLEINKDFLNHDYYTDIVTFDYTEGVVLSADVMISIDRVNDNANTFRVSGEEELRRVIAHGILHLMGYDDGTVEEKQLMRIKESEMMKMFHVEQ